MVNHEFEKIVWSNCRGCHGRYLDLFGNMSFLYEFSRFFLQHIILCTGTGHFMALTAWRGCGRSSEEGTCGEFAQRVSRRQVCLARLCRCANANIYLGIFILYQESQKICNLRNPQKNIVYMSSRCLLIWGIKLMPHKVMHAILHDLRNQFFQGGSGLTGKANYV